MDDPVAPFAATRDAEIRKEIQELSRILIALDAQEDV
jgi:hypothetical protein